MSTQAKQRIPLVLCEFRNGSQIKSSPSASAAWPTARLHASVDTQPSTWASQSFRMTAEMHSGRSLIRADHNGPTDQRHTPRCCGLASTQQNLNQRGWEHKGCHTVRIPTEAQQRQRSHLLWCATFWGGTKGFLEDTTFREGGACSGTQKTPLEIQKTFWVTQKLFW